MVPPAVIGVGLPATTLVPFLAGFVTGNFTNIPSIAANIIVVGLRTYEEASAKALQHCIFIDAYI
jgi:hypothetical protein